MDNGSEPPYESAWTYKENVGYFYPLKTLYRNYKDPVLGLMHNDVFIFDDKWPEKVLECFEKHPKLGMLGLAGWEFMSPSGEVDGMKANFLPGSFQDNPLVIHPEGLDQNISCLDSLFLAVRADLIPKLHITSEILPYHWYDRIWSLFTMEQGYSLGVLGLPFEHIGGQTALREEKYTELALKWCKDRGINTDDPDGSIYREGKERFKEYAEMLIGPPKDQTN